jgi:putative ABC transport system permease protein
MIYKQAVWNSAAGIPLGLIFAVITAKINPRILNIVNPTLSVNDVVSVKIWVFLIAGCFAFLTNWVSCKKPAKIAGDSSPIEALRYIAGTNKRKNRKRENGSVYSMALQNMFRDKKQAVVILLSFVIAVSIFMTVNVVIRENDARIILNTTYSYDLRLKNETTLDDDRKQLITVQDEGNFKTN